MKDVVLDAVFEVKRALYKFGGLLLSTLFMAWMLYLCWPGVQAIVLALFGRHVGAVTPKDVALFFLTWKFVFGDSLARTAAEQAEAERELAAYEISQRGEVASASVDGGDEN